MFLKTRAMSNESGFLTCSSLDVYLILENIVPFDTYPEGAYRHHESSDPSRYLSPYISLSQLTD